jgi:hypothetical protein
MDDRDLKIQALREGFRDRVAAITDDYENRIADLRIELTKQSNKADRLGDELEAVRGELQWHLDKENNVPEEAPTDADSA